jgi:hypothetical protein
MLVASLIQHESVCAIFSSVIPLALPHFPHCLKNGAIFEKKKCIEHKERASIFFVTFV